MNDFRIASILFCVLCQIILSTCLPPAIPKEDWNAMAQRVLKEALALEPNRNVAKNVILFLGDGMGISTVTAGRIYTAQQKNRPGEESTLAFDKFPHVALSKTYNVNNQVPDSAGTATAYLCGVKANMGVIGVNENVRRGNCSDMAGGSNAVDSVLRWSINEGKRTGVVTTTRITHATPSASYAHCPERDWEADKNIPLDQRHQCEDIALQLVTRNSDINVILGGGRQNFLPTTEKDPEYVTQHGSRLDGRNLIKEWEDSMQKKSLKSTFVWNKDQFNNVDATKTDHLLGLFEPSHMQYRLHRTKDGAGEPTLREMTDTAIQILKRGNKGYFLLVEGGRIDHGHHESRAKLALEEVVGFNEAIERAVDMTDSSDTLIVVTADHSHVFTIGGYPSRGNPILGVVDEIGFQEEPSLDNLPYLTLMYANGPNIIRTNLTGKNTAADDFQQPSHVPVKEETHGGEDVGIFALGPMSHLFHGVHEQNYIAHVMAYASCVGRNKQHCANSAQQRHLANRSYITVTSVVLLFTILRDVILLE